MSRFTLGLCCYFIALASAMAADQIGIASWYGDELRGKAMANGKPFDPDKLTCAHWGYSFGTKLRVSYSGKSVVVTVTDRGPNRRLGRAIDLSQEAFRQLADIKKGLIEVTIERVE